MKTMKIKTPKNQEIVQTTYMNGFENNPTHVITYNKITGRYRKERAKAEVNRIVQRYDSECGKVHTYKVDPEILKDYYPGSELPGSKIEAGNDMSGKEKTEKERR